MIISRLTLHNFGVYAGTNTFVFKNNKPVVLIGGMNGRGKTTFLNAVLLSLYGSNSFAYRESSYSSYGQYLRSMVNENDGTGCCFVEIVFKIDADGTDVYTVHRAWNTNNKRVKEELEVTKNQEKDEFLSNNWLVFIENLLPSALSPYFFFDGDNIAELAVGSTEEKMKEAIKALLGISVLDQLENDLSRIENRVIRDSNTGINENELSKLQEKLDGVKKELDSIDDKISSDSEKREDIKTKLEQQNSEYISKGGLLVEQRQELYQKRSEKKIELQSINQQKIDLAASELPLILIFDLLLNIDEKAKNSRDVREMKTAAKRITEAFERYNGSKTIELENFINYIESLSNQEVGTDELNFTESAIFQLSNLVSASLKTRLSQAVELEKRSQKVSSEIDGIDKHLSVDIDEKAVNTLFKKIKQYEQKEIELDEKIERLQRQRSEINGGYIRLVSEYKQLLDKTLSESETHDKGSRLLKYNSYAGNILTEYKIRLQKRKIDTLTTTITACFKKIANKQNLIEKIEMDPVTLDFSYVDMNGKIVPKESLSEGEKQMMIISILWALAICSKRKLPVIIDTPLARLDSEHRKALIKTYFPNAGEQTIILSTDSEIGGEYYNLLNDYVSDEYTLIYNDETKSTHIVNGYFGEMK